MTPAQSRVLLVLALVAATLILFGVFVRYQTDQPQILQNGDFSDGLSSWRATGAPGQLQLEQGILRLRAERAGHFPGVRQIVGRDPGMDKMRLSGWVRHSGVASGLQIWNAVRVLLLQRNSHGDPLWALPHTVHLGRGDSPWRKVSEVFWLPVQVRSVEVIVVLNRVIGEMQVRGLILETVQERPAFTLARHGLVAVWLLALPWLIWPLYKAGPKRLRRLGVVFLAAIILAGVLMPNSVKSRLHDLADDVRKSDWVASIKTMQVRPKAARPPASKAPASASRDKIPSLVIWVAAQKLGHVGFFTLMALTVTLVWRRLSWQRLCLYLSTFAVAAETLQLLSVDRNAALMDAGLNLLGTAAGLALGLAAVRLAKPLKAPI
jgi:hypothetical protein